MNYAIWRFFFYIQRLKCLFLGCKEAYEANDGYMPDDWNSPTYCKRCMAEDDPYGVTSTPFHVLYSQDSFWQRLKEYFVWEE